MRRTVLYNVNFRYFRLDVPEGRWQISKPVTCKPQQAVFTRRSALLRCCPDRKACITPPPPLLHFLFLGMRNNALLISDQPLQTPRSLSASPVPSGGMRDYVPPGVGVDDRDRRLFDIVEAMRHVTDPDARAHLAEELRAAVDNINEVGETNLRPFFDTDHANERGPAVAELIRRLHRHLTSTHLNDRLAAIAAFTALIFTESESMHARTQRTSNAIRVLFSTTVTDIATAADAASMVASFARLNSPMSARAVEYALNNATSLIGSATNEQPNAQLSMDLARAAMVISRLAAEDKVSNVIFIRQTAKLCRDMWKVCWDDNIRVREQGVRALRAVLEITVARSERPVAERTMRDVMQSIRHTLSPATSPSSPNLPPCPKSEKGVPVVHGSMTVLGSLLDSDITDNFMNIFSSELCNLVLPYQTCKQPLLRQAVADILPLLVKLDREQFAARFLDSVHTSTLNLIRDHNFPAEERGRSLVALSVIAEQVPRKDKSRLLGDMLSICREALRIPDPGEDVYQMPEDAAITAISHLAEASEGSPIFEKAVREGMLTQMFNTNFTNALVTAVDNIGHAIPSFAEPIRLRLVHLIAATLKKRMPSRKGVVSRSGPVEEEQRSERMARLKSVNSVVPRTRSFLSLGITSGNVAGQTQLRDDRMQRGTLHGRDDLKADRQARARDYFRSVPICQELHRIDTNSLLASRSDDKTFNNLLKEDLMSSSWSNRGGHPSLIDGGLDPAMDMDNSPCVALKAIVSYDFSDMQVQDFISFATEFVIGYVEYNSVKVRALAVAACAKLMVSAATQWAGPKSARRLPRQLRPGIHAILAQLLSLAVADPSKDVRFVAIRSLNQPIFHPYLVQPEMLDKLFMCCFDESLAMRDSALAIAGLLSDSNPAHVLPALRYHLMHFTIVLKCDGDFFARDRRQVTELLYTLVHNAPSLIMPYITALMDAILLRLQEAHRSGDISSALPALKAVADMGGTMSRIDLRPFKNQLVPLLVSAVLDAQSADSLYKIAALRALAAFVQNTALAIQPYLRHPGLLPELIQLLRSETDPKVRLTAGILLGSLGAVDPVDHKYAAIIDYSEKRKKSSADKISSGGSQSRSLFIPVSAGVQGVMPWGISAPRPVRPSTNIGGKLSLDQGRQVKPHLEPRGTNLSQEEGSEKLQANNSLKAVADGVLDDPRSKQEVEVSLALFGLGGTGLAERIAGYCPQWAEDEILKDSLMSRLEHPFTASPDYFPSAALNALHKIIGNPRLRVQHREACQAIVNILKSTGLRCASFLPSVVPRIQWLLAQSLSKESPKGTTFGQLEQHLMQRLADIVATAGHSFVPFTFDTVLLVWTFLNAAKDSTSCITSVCSLLSRLRVAVSDEFKPIIATVLPPLLAALAQDRSANGVVSRAVLRTLESFAPLLGNYREIALLTLSRVAVTRRTCAIRAEALTALSRIVSSKQSVEVLSAVMHPLMRILAGAKDRSYMQTDWKQQDNGRMSQESRLEWMGDEKLAVLAAAALTKIEARASSSFDVFVPVVAKALRASDVRDSNMDVYCSLKACLMRRNAGVVGELLSEDIETGYGSLSVLLDVNQGGDMNTSKVRGLAPLVRGGALQGQPSLPEGTKIPQARVPVVEYALVAKWEVNHNFTSEDWINWFESVRVVMFEQSGSPAFRACGRVSDSYPHFIRQLFNAAFLSCWTTTLSSATKTRICDSLEIAMTSDTIPLNILQAILYLFEYMDHAERPLPASTENLALTACRCGAFAKALRYREQNYVQHLESKDKLKEDVCGENGLIGIYEKLGHTESAVGTIKHYRENSGESLQEEWLEKLQQWDEALKAYEKTDLFLDDIAVHSDRNAAVSNALYADKRKWGHLLGRLRCLNELGEWREMNDLLQRARKGCIGNLDALRQLALEGKGASVAFDLGRWTEFEEWVGVLQPGSYDYCFYKTLLMVKRGRETSSYLDAAQKFLHQARCKLDLDLTARVSEAYPRAYGHVVCAQVLVELEEIIQFLRLSYSDSVTYGRRRLDDVWAERLKGCKQDRYTWYRLLMIRSLVQRPVEVKDQWLEFTTMCRKNNRLPMASEALRMLVSSCEERTLVRRDELSRTQYHSSDRLPRVEDWNDGFFVSIRDLEVRFACIKHLWAVGKHTEAYDALKACMHEYWSDPEPLVLFDSHAKAEATYPGSDAEKLLAAEVFSELSIWGDKIVEDGTRADIDDDEPLVYAGRAVEIRPDWSKAWHNWGAFNATRFEALMKGKGSRGTTRMRPKRRSWHTPAKIPELGHGKPGRRYFEQAVKGFFKAIDLNDSTARLEDSLKVLTLWFNYGGYSKAHVVFDECFKVTNIVMWLEVVPQIIARLYSPFPGVQRGVKDLLTRIGKEHPQIAVYPLIVAKGAIGGGLEKRRRAAVEILSELRRHHPEIVEQSDLVSRELVRAGIMWAEMWFEKLEEASKLYFVEHKLDHMLDVLLPLHAEMEKGAETVYEGNFVREFGQILQEAGDLMKRFGAGHRSGIPEQRVAVGDCLTTAWQLYQEVFRKLQKHQNSLVVMDLAKVSKRLSDVSNLVLAVPGTYDPNQADKVVGIQKFGAQLTVLQSKQRPRRMSILGSDGHEYHFLLKGHEDLRQDERVMQVFRLVNKLFTKSTRRAVLTGVEMKTYEVISLSSNVGIIEWVPDCDTMHALVKEYREVHNIMPNVEHKVMLRLAAEPDRLPLLHKVDLFELMLQQTVSVDIAKVLWLKSRNSEMWLERRNTYAKSLATTSMTGYLLGLGDRHPSNVMIERSTGRVMHIDFGDCFEVAMKREKFPENVPFRLTRMLVQALEPCGVDGYFRHTSEATMDVLRQKNPRDSLMAMMEAFVYDPLLRWKLIGDGDLDQIRKEDKRNGGDERTGPQTPADTASLLAITDSEGTNDLMRSLWETGSLTASDQKLRRQEQERARAAAATTNPTGAVPMPNANKNIILEDKDIEIDPADLQTPNEVARSRLLRAVEDGLQFNDEKINDISNERAQCALDRFETKLYGTDFDPDVELSVPDQVDLLIREAQNIEHLCALFMGWCAFW